MPLYRWLERRLMWYPEHVRLALTRVLNRRKL